MTGEIKSYHYGNNEYITPPDGVSARVFAERINAGVMFPTLYLILAHPALANGIDKYSGKFNEDTGRFERTQDIVTDLFFGTVDRAVDAAQIINSKHEHVILDHRAGETITANYPRYLQWVFLSLMYASVRGHEIFINPQLSKNDKNRIIEEQKNPMQLLGIPGDFLPSTFDEVEQQIEDTITHGEVFVGEQARAVTYKIATPPKVLRPALRPLWNPVVNMFNASILPDRIRQQYNIPAGGKMTGFTQAAIHAVMPFIPDHIRYARFYRDLHSQSRPIEEQHLEQASRGTIFSFSK